MIIAYNVNGVNPGSTVNVPIIKDEECIIISESSSNLVFFCTSCIPKVDSALASFNGLNITPETCNQKPSATKEKLNSLIDTISKKLDNYSKAS